MSDIHLVPASVDGAGARLHGAAGGILGAGTKAQGALGDTSGLPPAFQGRAANLADRCPSAKFASDCFAVNGLELKRRASIAMMEQNAGRSPGLPLGALRTVRSGLAVSSKIHFWNKATAAAAAKRPGRFHRDISRIGTSPPGKPSTYGRRECVDTWHLPNGRALLQTTGPDLSPAFRDMLKKGGKKFDPSKISKGDMKLLGRLGFRMGYEGYCRIDLGKGTDARVTFRSDIEYRLDAEQERSRGSKPINVFTDKVNVTTKLEGSVGSDRFRVFVAADDSRDMPRIPDKAFVKDLVEEHKKKFLKPNLKDLKEAGKKGLKGTIKVVPGVKSDDPEGLWNSLKPKESEAAPVYDVTVGSDGVLRPILKR
ncbi:MAG: hypothetical protein Q7T55_16280 [Solirubrobacteraceae bacterium]|nr:hypothetical protein [Solirubrobacteraceae bacterium]